jgi:cellulase
MVYIASADSDGEGAVWTKLYEDGYDGSKWGVDNFITNKGAITITLPDLVAGEYLIRPEIIALHEAQTQGKAQFYNGCGQIKITGSGSASLPSTGTDMTKAYSATDPGVMVNIYSGLTSYEIPGPAVWDGSSSGGGESPASSAPAATSTAAPTKATATATPTQVQDVVSTTTAAPSTPTATGGADSGNGSLPETFTLDEFITWLQANAGSSQAKRFIRAIAGSRAHARDFL